MTARISIGSITIILAADLAIAVANGSVDETCPFTIIYEPIALIGSVVLLEKYRVENSVSVHCQQKANRNTVIIIFFAEGSTTEKKVRGMDAPSM